MENISYIVPLHEYNDTVKDYLLKAFESLNNVIYTEGDKLIFVGPKDIIEKANSLYGETNCKQESILVENDDTDFFKQVNKAVFSCITPYFTIFEFDDEFFPYWNKVLQEYMTTDSSVLIPLNGLFENGKMVAFANEIAWSPSFASDASGLGYLDMDCLETYSNFNLTGALFKTESFISIGCLKPNLKIAAWQEFLKRCIYNGKQVYVVPKIAYKHTINRDNSFMKINSNISANEAEYLIKAANQEYFFKEEREINYTE